MKKLLKFLDNYGLAVWAGWLLIFIPWYPKIPLTDILPGYIVRLRLEDFFIAIGLGILIRHLMRFRKSLTKTPLFKPILFYIIIGFLSSVSAILLTKTVPAETIHIAKLFLHWARRIEYFSLFFIFYYAAASLPKKIREKVFWPLILVLLGIIIYGFGQKYLYWPVFSTMNREFSKGMVLYLTEHARVPSTFGGHYDLAIFLVIVLPIMLALFHSAKKRLWQIVAFIAFGLGFWLLILTASRTSFVAYLITVVVFYFLLIFKKSWWWSLWRAAVVVAASMVIMLSFGDLSSRYAHFFTALKSLPATCLDEEASQQKLELLKEAPLPGRKSTWEKDDVSTASQSGVCKTIVAVNKVISFEFMGNFYNRIFKESKLAQYLETRRQAAEKKQAELLAQQTSPVTETDQQPEPEKPLPPDVYEDIPDEKVVKEATESGEIEEKIVYMPRTYSDNAYKYGLSMAIRLDALWPKALSGLKANPALGSGYSTLTKEKVTDFTEAESTDNDYLRMLGETGLLGFGSFMAIIGLVFYQALKLFRKTQKPAEFFIAVAVMALVIGLLINALYIDVFEASKVAYSLWALVGIFFAYSLKTIKSK